MPSGTFSADGEISPRHFLASALLVGRVRHSRALDHYGTQETDVVVLEAAIGGYAAGTDVQTVLEGLHARIVALEGVSHTVRQFAADAFIAWCVRANATIQGNIASSIKGDAVFVGYSQQAGSVTASAWIYVPGSARTFTARAYFIDYVG